MGHHIKAVILDWAGTSVDYGSMAPVIVFIEVFREKGIAITPVDARSFMGMAKKEHTRKILQLDHVRRQWIKIFGNGPDESDVEAIFNSLDPKLAEVACALSEPIPGAVNFVEDMRSQGIKVGTTTGYVSSMMERIVPEAHKRGFVPDCIINSSDVPGGRPLPYMCFLNAIKMDVYPLSQMIKIGDTVADIQEGLNAGMWTIGLTQSGNEIGLSHEEIQTLDMNELQHLISRAESKLRLAGAHYVANGIWDCLPIIDAIEERISNGERP